MQEPGRPARHSGVGTNGAGLTMRREGVVGGVDPEPATGIEAFVAAHGPQLVRLATLLTASRQDAEDLWQETLVDLIRHWDRVEAAATPRAYARRVLVNRHLSTRRRPFWRRERPTDPVLLPDNAAEPIAIREPPGSVEALRQQLAALTPRVRTVLVLRYYEDLTDAEIAAALGIAKGSVSAAASRGIQALRLTLAKEATDD